MALRSSTHPRKSEAGSTGRRMICVFMSAILLPYAVSGLLPVLIMNPLKGDPGGLAHEAQLHVDVQHRRVQRVVPGADLSAPGAVAFFSRAPLQRRGDPPPALGAPRPRDPRVGDGARLPRA